MAATTCPAFVVQENTDIQVRPEDARMLAASRSGVELLLLDGANHLFKPVSRDAAAQMTSYSSREPAIDPRLVAAIVGFVRSVSAP